MRVVAWRGSPASARTDRVRGAAVGRPARAGSPPAHRRSSSGRRRAAPRHACQPPVSPPASSPAKLAVSVGLMVIHTTFPFQMALRL